MGKNTKIILIVVGVAVAAYFAWRWYQNSSASSGSGGTDLWSNLNSVAPELVGGSTGPNTTSGPAVALPVNITLNETAPVATNGEMPMLGANNRVPSSLSRQTAAAADAPGIVTPDSSNSPGGAAITKGAGTSAHKPVKTMGGYQQPAASGGSVTAPHHPSGRSGTPVSNEPSRETTGGRQGKHPLSTTERK